MREYLVRLKHDLGKYIAFQVRYLPPGASASERREALAADLLGTRRGPEGVRDAPSVWAEFRATLPKGASTLRIAFSVNQAGAGYLGGASRPVAVTIKRGV